MTIDKLASIKYSYKLNKIVIESVSKRAGSIMMRQCVNIIAYKNVF